jgi:carboxylesterase type B
MFYLGYPEHLPRSSPDKLTIWGESAGARSLGMQLIAYDGMHNSLFRSATIL